MKTLTFYIGFLHLHSSRWFEWICNYKTQYLILLLTLNKIENGNVGVAGWFFFSVCAIYLYLVIALLVCRVRTHLAYQSGGHLLEKIAHIHSWPLVWPSIRAPNRWYRIAEWPFFKPPNLGIFSEPNWFPNLFLVALKTSKSEKVKDSGGSAGKIWWN